MEICEKNYCTGCQTCRLICQNNAIKFEPDKKGFYYPIINESLCTECSECIKFCPSNFSSIQNNEPYSQQKVYAAWIKNKKIRLYSTSGGLFYVFAKFVIQNEGVVFGVEWHDYGARHTYCTNINDLNKFQGSKYVQSDIGNSYSQVKQFLNNDKLVLFTGTPCQIAGLKSYLKKPYENLITIDLVCHGVPSPKILKEYIKIIEEKQNDKVISVRFRHKTPNWVLTSMKFDFYNSISLYQSVFVSPYFRGFVENYYLRESCYHCKYANTQRQGDITLGDFWGYNPSSFKFASYKKGTSLVIINSQKGKKLFNNIASFILFEEKEISIAQKGNRNLLIPQDKPIQYDKFWEEYFNNLNLNLLSNKYFPPMPIPKEHIFKNKLKLYVKLMLPTFILNKIKKIHK